MSDIKIIQLADQPDAIPLIGMWLYFQQKRVSLTVSVESIIADFGLRLNKACLPLALTAHLKNRISGTVSLTETGPAPDVGPPWLSDLYVAPGARGRGVGAALVCGAVEQARQLGFDEVYLLSDGLQAFFRRFGAEEVPGVSVEDEPGVVMRIPIAQRDATG